MIDHEVESALTRIVFRQDYTPEEIQSLRNALMRLKALGVDITKGRSVHVPPSKRGRITPMEN